jgi:hypothetical protein
VLLTSFVYPQIPEYKEGTGNVELFFVLGDDSTVRQLKIEGKNRQGNSLESVSVPLDASLFLNGVAAGIWDFVIEGLDAHSEVVQSVALSQILVEKNLTTAVNVVFPAVNQAKESLAPSAGEKGSSIGPKPFPPVFSLTQGIAQRIEMTCATEGAAIHYRYVLDGKPLEGPFKTGHSLEVPRGHQIEVEAYAKQGTEQSETVGVHYELSPEPLIPQKSEPYTNYVNVTILGPGVRYSINGGGFSPYTSPLKILEDGSIVEAFCMEEGKVHSAIVKSVFSIQVATPSLETKQVEKEKVVYLSCDTPEATIYYTVDGSEPSSASQIYTGPFPLESTEVVKAFARKKGLADSAVVNRLAIFIRAKEPTITLSEGEQQVLVFSSPEEEATYKYRLAFDGKAVEGPFLTGTEIPVPAGHSLYVEAYTEVSLKKTSPLVFMAFPVAQKPIFSVDSQLKTAPFAVSLSADNAIRYRLDEQPFQDYEGKISIEKSQLVSAYGASLHAINSETVVCEYRFQVPSPSLMVKEGTDGTKILSLACVDHEAQIYFSLNGSTPWAVYTDPVEIAADCTVQAVAKREGFVDSPLLEGSVNFLKTEAPVILLSEGDNQTVTITSATPGSTIWYRCATELKRLPDSYIKGSSFSVVAGEPLSVEAYARSEGMLASEVVSVSFPVADPPLFGLPEGTYDSVLTLPLAGSHIRYRNEEDVAYRSVAGETVEISHTDEVIHAFCQERGKVNSAEKERRYVLQVVPPQIFDLATPDGRVVSLSCKTEGAVITYSVAQGEETVYEKPFVLTESSIVSAVAQREGFASSSEVSEKLEVAVQPPVEEKKVEKPVVVEPLVVALPPEPLKTEEPVLVPISYQVGGEGPAGGTIFYDKGSFTEGWRYLECAPADEESPYAWGQYGMDVRGTSTLCGSGRANTDRIIASCTDGYSAAYVCKKKTLEHGGVVYSDWFLPSIEELLLMLSSPFELKLSDQCFYWSSSADSRNYALEGCLNKKGPCSYFKSSACLVRAIRAF